MDSDDKAIRELVTLWHTATAAGDVDTVLTLMADDVVFLVAGHAPMRGRGEFERGLRNLLLQYRVESTGDIHEVEVNGSLAYCWAHLTVRVIPLAGGKIAVRSGNVLSILRKQVNGSWLIARDANLLTLVN
ncbi:MAG: SgcJ/EcaC family oxidoreductase [Verrucomicrobiaceae bacterium]|nr:SgcJ/EcaC family oxidoreductase [Verrucomicrobiaceae bacterium]